MRFFNRESRFDRDITEHPYLFHETSWQKKDIELLKKSIFKLSEVVDHIAELQETLLTLSRQINR